MDEEDFFPFADDSDDDTTVTAHRDQCYKCGRPRNVCWCPHLPNPRIRCLTRVYVLQTPAEIHRPLQTALMLLNGLDEGLCKIFLSRKFNAKRNLEQANLLSAPNSLLLYPGPEAISIDQVPRDEYDSYNLILLDGTWREARRLYNQNEILKNMRMVKLPETGITSDYIVRTQPRDGCLSTVESAALAISLLEDRAEIFEQLTKPLRLACRFQLEHGAAVHESKERKKEKALQQAGATKP